MLVNVYNLEEDEDVDMRSTRKKIIDVMKYYNYK